jgi:ATP-dependent DNA helicase RecQ
VVERVDGRWTHTSLAWEYPTARGEAVTALRRAEQAAMREYAATGGCRMEFLRAELDDPNVTRCGRCDNCTQTRWTVDLDPALVADARAYLRGGFVAIEPRKQWPPGLESPRGRIAADLQLAPGRALSVFNDDGWGREVRRAMRETGIVPDELVAASADLVRRWRPDPPPEWVTAVPSSGFLVADFAARLATALGLPFRDVVARTREAPPQREMENSAQQVRNVLGAFAVGGSVAPTPVLLVDDVFDSRWTLTAVGILLREAGSGPVYPFVLARAVTD